MKQLAKRFHFGLANGVWVATALMLSAMVGLICFAIPGNIDEHSALHALACWYFPANTQNVGFIDDCYRFKLWLFGQQVWERSYYYLGAVPSLLYYPLYRLWASPLSAQCMGIALYALSIVGASRLLRVPLWCALIAFASNYFLLYLAVRDFGGVAIHIAAAIFLPLLAKRVVDASSRAHYIGYSMLLAALMFAAFETKPIFVYLIPSICILTLVAYPEWIAGKIQFLHVCRRLLPAGVGALFLIACLVSLSITEYRDVSYFSMLTKANGGSMHEAGYEARLARSVDCVAHVTSTVSFLRRSGSTNCAWTPHYAQWIDPAMPRMVSLLYLGWVMVLIAACAYWRPATRKPIGWLLAAGFLVLILVNMHGGARQAHHYFMAWVMWACALSVALLELRRSAVRYWNAGAIGLCLAGLSIAVMNSYIIADPAVSWDRWAVMRKLDQDDIAPLAMVVDLQWGTYFTSSLYGPREQFEVHYKDFSRRTWRVRGAFLQHARNTAWRSGRELLFVGMRRNVQWHMIRRAFPTMVQLYPPAGEPATWVIWGDAHWLQKADWSMR